MTHRTSPRFLAALVLATTALCATDARAAGAAGKHYVVATDTGTTGDAPLYSITLGTAFKLRMKIIDQATGAGITGIPAGSLTPLNTLRNATTGVALAVTTNYTAGTLTEVGGGVYDQTLTISSGAVAGDFIEINSRVPNGTAGGTVDAARFSSTQYVRVATAGAAGNAKYVEVQPSTAGDLTNAGTVNYPFKVSFIDATGAPYNPGTMTWALARYRDNAGATPAGTWGVSCAYTAPEYNCTLTATGTTLTTGNRYYFIFTATIGNYIYTQSFGLTAVAAQNNTPLANLQYTTPGLFAAAGNLNVQNGTNPATANAQQGSVNQAIDGFTMAMSTGSGQVNSLTLTTSAQFTAANVTNIRLYRDAGTLGSYQAGTDTLVPSTFSIGASTATITITTPESVSTTANYLITVDVAAAASIGNTLTARVTGASGTIGTPTYNDTASATLTITAGTCVRSAPTVALSPPTANVDQGGSTAYGVTLTNNDTAAFCSNSTFTLSAADSNLTDFSASTLSATSPSPCTLAPGASCTATLTVTARAGGAAGNTNTTTVTSSDATNHNGQNGTSNVVSTITALPPAQVPAGNAYLFALLIGAMLLFGARALKQEGRGAR